METVKNRRRLSEANQANSVSALLNKYGNEYKSFKAPELASADDGSDPMVAQAISFNRNRRNNGNNVNNGNRRGWLKPTGIVLLGAVAIGALYIGARNTNWYGLADGDEKTTSESTPINETPQDSGLVPQEGTNMFRYGVEDYNRVYGERADEYNFGRAYDLQNTSDSIEGFKNHHMEVVRGNAALADYFTTEAGMAAQGDTVGSDDQGAYLYTHRAEAETLINDYEKRFRDAAAIGTVGYEDGSYVSDQLDHVSNVVSPTDVIWGSSATFNLDIDLDGQTETMQAICADQYREEVEVPVYVPEVYTPVYEDTYTPAPVYETVVHETPYVPPAPQITIPQPPTFNFPGLPPINIPPIPPINFPPIPPIKPPVPPVVPPVTPPVDYGKIPQQDINVNPNVINNPDLGMGDFRAPAPTEVTPLAVLPDTYVAPTAPLDSGLDLGGFTGPAIESNLGGMTDMGTSMPDMSSGMTAL